MRSILAKGDDVRRETKANTRVTGGTGVNRQYVKDGAVGVRVGKIKQKIMRLIFPNTYRTKLAGELMRISAGGPLHHLFTWYSNSHLNTPIDQGDSAYWLSYFLKCNRDITRMQINTCDK